GAVDGAVKAVAHEVGQVAAVVGVRVAEDHRVDGFRRGREAAVARPRLGTLALGKSAVEQEFAALGFGEVHRAGDGGGGAPERDGRRGGGAHAGDSTAGGARGNDYSRPAVERNRRDARVAGLLLHALESQHSDVVVVKRLGAGAVSIRQISDVKRIAVA